MPFRDREFEERKEVADNSAKPSGKSKTNTKKNLIKKISEKCNSE